MTEEPKDRDEELLNKVADELSGQFDSVRIFITRHDGIKGTCRIAVGRGNFYAQCGQIREWLIEQDTMAAKNAEPEKD